jgi:hypothetical protein
VQKEWNPHQKSGRKICLVVTSMLDIRLSAALNLLLAWGCGTQLLLLVLVPKGTPLLLVPVTCTIPQPLVVLVLLDDAT